jgi:hypothetical protein
MSLYAIFSPEYEFVTKIFCLGFYAPVVILAIRATQGDK